MKAKVYKFEQMKPFSGDAEPFIADGSTVAMYEKIMSEISLLRAHICPNAEDSGVAGNTPTAASASTPDMNNNTEEAAKLKAELDEIYSAIAQTKKEIATISAVGFESMQARPVDELDAVVQGTEAATNQILTAIEHIERDATVLADSLAGDEGLLASNIQEQILSVYEACNFQDITGQRINKVVSVLRFVSERTDKMIEIWGGSSSFEAVDADEAIGRDGDAKLLNGPAMEEDETTASQGDIDDMFN